MKRTKKIGAFLLAVFMCFALAIPASAQEIEPKYGEREVVTVLKTEYDTVTVTPSGQLEGGYRFSTGGGLFVNKSGGPTVTVSLSVSWEVLGVSVNIGTAGKSSSIGGSYIEAPNTKDYFKAKIDKTFKV